MSYFYQLKAYGFDIAGRTLLGWTINDRCQESHVVCKTKCDSDVIQTSVIQNKYRCKENVMYFYATRVELAVDILWDFVDRQLPAAHLLTNTDVLDIVICWLNGGEGGQFCPNGHNLKFSCSGLTGIIPQSNYRILHCRNASCSAVYISCLNICFWFWNVPVSFVNYQQKGRGRNEHCPGNTHNEI